ncbi:hypothetical protein DGMP_27480 [Desulfomarina profundi]|uniref:Extradiol ring-cleavage dioxygenase class III enzyme subunit B domain-containing protein n=1 Tax=Desulfomarina profundi TaxID=2772557 RepID=A0A8D5FQU6_9BACT|nr:hypothetical protein [Desulfomarina profundi]BCL62055.1 hypothetical protein DGMP_27480 [Desulfomarina profundi]
MSLWSYSKGVKPAGFPETLLALEYGSLVPMRYMNSDRHFKVVSVSAQCMFHKHDNSAVVDRDKYQGRVEVLTPYFPSSGTGQINAVLPVL